MGVQIALFDISGMKEKVFISVDAYYSEFQSLGNHQRRNAGYGGDVRAEREVRELIRQGEHLHKQWRGRSISDESCKDALYELIVHLWCVKVNGMICRDIYQTPAAPKTYKPVFDNHLAQRIPSEMLKIIPKENVLLVCYEENEGIEQRSYCVTYYRTDTGHWYSAVNHYDSRKCKWTAG